MQIFGILFFTIASSYAMSFGVTTLKSLPSLDELSTTKQTKALFRKSPRKTMMTSQNPYSSSAQYIPQTPQSSYTFTMPLSSKPIVSPPASKEQGITDMVLVPRAEYQKYRDQAISNPDSSKAYVGQGFFDGIVNTVNKGVSSAGKIGIGMIGTGTDFINNGVQVQTKLFNSMSNSQTQTYANDLVNNNKIKTIQAAVDAAALKAANSSVDHASANSSYYSNTYGNGFRKKRVI